MNPLNLNIGCGTGPEPGAINCDLWADESVDVVMDAIKPWPFKDNSVKHITCSHILEHVDDPFALLGEAWRVLEPNGYLMIRVPYGPSEAGVGDMTHQKYYTLSSFACLQPGYSRDSHNLGYNSNTTHFEVVQVHLRINADLSWMVKPFIRKLGLRIIPYLWNGYTELLAGLVALKDDVAIRRWEINHSGPSGRAVRYCRCMYQHEYEGRKRRAGEADKWRYF